jgi:NAD(P)-dependent dehydrogenase (short-subunit alcohol dehydrogenase family)
MHKKINFFDFSNKTILITGAASGIGKAVSILFSSLGAKLILLDVNELEIKETIRKCSGNVHYIIADLVETEKLKDKIEAKIAECGQLDALVHVAGIPCISPLKTLKTETAEKVFKINTLSALELSKIFTKNKNFKVENPSIVFISSVYGLVGSSANVAYAMSKTALHGITKSLAIELAAKKVRVNCVAPGFIKTEMLNEVSDSFDQEYHERLNKLHPLGLGTPNDVAYAILFLVSDMSKWITGTILSVDGGFTAQ